MVKAKELRFRHFHGNIPDYFFLPKTKLISDHSRKHDQLCADLYVAFYTAVSNLRWERPTDAEENVILGLYPDRQMVAGGQIVFWEVDRGTEDYISEKGISGKVEKYIRLSELHKEHRFQVVFTTVNTEKSSAKTRGASMLKVFERYNRADQFLTTLHKWAVEEPLNPVYLSPFNPQGISIIPAI